MLYDFGALLRAQLDPAGRYGQRELELGHELTRQVGRNPQGVHAPLSALMPAALQRDLTVGTGGGSTGGKLVATNLLADRFIDLLRNRAAIMPHATVLGGLVGNVAIPRQTGPGTSYWVAEGEAPTESAQAFDQVTMSPKTLGAFVDVSRKLILQGTPQALEIVKSDLTAALGLAIDLAAVQGGGTNEPTGILETSGVSSTDLAGAALTWAHVVGLETTIASANVDDEGIMYLMHPAVAGLLRERTAVATYGSEPMLTGPRTDARLNGRRAIISNQVPTGTLIAGNLRDLIVGQWGVLDLLVDPYSASTTGTVRVVALQDVDIALRHTASFAALTNFV